MSHGGTFQGASHDGGGIPLVVQDTGQLIEVEGKEVLMPEGVYADENVYEFTGTNREILNQILSKNGLSVNDKATLVKSGDVVICKVSAADKSKHTYKGTIKKIISNINESGGCNPVVDSDTKQAGGSIIKELSLESNQKKNVFELEVGLAVYVPSTADVKGSISESEMQGRIHLVKEYLGSTFGGFTSVDTQGGYLSNDKELVEENVVKVTSFATRDTFEKNKKKLVCMIAEWAREWGQEAIGLEMEGNLLYISKEVNDKNCDLTKMVAKKEKGGMLEKRFIVQPSADFKGKWILVDTKGLRINYGLYDSEASAQRDADSENAPIPTFDESVRRQQKLERGGIVDGKLLSEALYRIEEIPGVLTATAISRKEKREQNLDDVVKWKLVTSPEGSNKIDIKYLSDSEIVAYSKKNNLTSKEIDTIPDAVGAILRKVHKMKAGGYIPEYNKNGISNWDILKRVSVIEYGSREAANDIITSAYDKCKLENPDKNLTITHGVGSDLIYLKIDPNLHEYRNGGGISNFSPFIGDARAIRIAEDALEEAEKNNIRMPALYDFISSGGKDNLQQTLDEWNNTVNRHGGFGIAHEDSIRLRKYLSHKLGKLESGGEIEELRHGGNVYDRGDRPSPRESATLFPEGHEAVGQDGNMYVVALDINEVHRWRKLHSTPTPKPKGRWFSICKAGMLNDEIKSMSGTKSEIAIELNKKYGCENTGDAKGAGFFLSPEAMEDDEIISLSGRVREILPSITDIIVYAEAEGAISVENSIAFTKSLLERVIAL